LLKDKKNARKLSAKEKLALVNEVRELSKVTLTGDDKVDKKNQDKAVAKAQGFLRDKRKAMDKVKKETKELEKAMDTTKPSTVKAFGDKQEEYYYAKAVYEAVE